MKVAVRVNWEEFHRHIHPVLCCLALEVVGSAQDAEDVAATALEKLVRHVARRGWESFGFPPCQDICQDIDLRKETEPVRRVCAWLCKVNRNAALDLVRKAGRLRDGGRRGLLYRTPVPAPVPNPEELRVQYAERARFLEALRQIGPADARILLLHYRHRKSYAEIALELGVNENAARKRVSRARGRFRQVWGHEERRHHEVTNRPPQSLIRRTADTVGDARGRGQTQGRSEPLDPIGTQTDRA